MRPAQMATRYGRLAQVANPLRPGGISRAPLRPQADRLSAATAAMPNGNILGLSRPASLYHADDPDQQARADEASNEVADPST